MLRADRDILPKSHSGRWLVVGLFVLGFIVLAGFFASRQYWKRIAPSTLPTSRLATLPANR